MAILTLKRNGFFIQPDDFRDLKGIDKVQYSDNDTRFSLNRLNAPVISEQLISDTLNAETGLFFTGRPELQDFLDEWYFPSNQQRGEKGDPGMPGQQGGKGDPGEKGEKGDPGDPGQKGDPGERGEPGSPGTPGESGQRGEDGQPGEKGDPGDKGEQGEKGEKGDTGLKGETGDKGDKGDIGDTGPRGFKGDTGEKGDKGDPGDKGEKGEIGQSGTAITYKGTRTSSSGLPASGNLNGDAYYVGTTTKELYVFNTATGVFDNQGAVAVKGDKGDTGAKGDTGNPGSKGDPGDKGDKGNTGDKGDRGDKGDKGDKGDPGTGGLQPASSSESITSANVAYASDPNIAYNIYDPFTKEYFAAEKSSDTSENRPFVYKITKNGVDGYYRRRNFPDLLLSAGCKLDGTTPDDVALKKAVSGVDAFTALDLKGRSICLDNTNLTKFVPLVNGFLRPNDANKVSLSYSLQSAGLPTGNTYEFAGLKLLPPKAGTVAGSNLTDNNFASFQVRGGQNNVRLVGIESCDQAKTGMYAECSAGYTITAEYCKWNRNGAKVQSVLTEAITSTQPYFPVADTTNFLVADRVFVGDARYNVTSIDATAKRIYVETNASGERLANLGFNVAQPFGQFVTKQKQSHNGFYVPGSGNLIIRNSEANDNAWFGVFANCTGSGGASWLRCDRNGYIGCGNTKRSDTHFDHLFLNNNANNNFDQNNMIRGRMSNIQTKGAGVDNVFIGYGDDNELTTIVSDGAFRHGLLYNGGNDAKITPKNLRISHSTFRNCNQAGVNITICSEVKAYGNTFELNGYQLKIEGGNDYVNPTGIKIGKNHFKDFTRAEGITGFAGAHIYANIRNYQGGGAAGTIDIDGDNKFSGSPKIYILASRDSKVFPRYVLNVASVVTATAGVPKEINLLPRKGNKTIGSNTNFSQEPIRVWVSPFPADQDENIEPTPVPISSLTVKAGSGRMLRTLMSSAEIVLSGTSTGNAIIIPTAPAGDYLISTEIAGYIQSFKYQVT